MDKDFFLSRLMSILELMTRQPLLFLFYHFLIKKLAYAFCSKESYRGVTTGRAVGFILLMRYIVCVLLQSKN